MTINVKYLSEQQIERGALGLLEAYFHDQGQPIQIPAYEILETHLGLALDFDDLQPCSASSMCSVPSGPTSAKSSSEGFVQCLSYTG